MNSDALIPPADETPLLKSSTTLLGWPRIQSALAHNASSPLTGEQCLRLAPETDLAAAHERLEETAEMVSWLESGETVPLETFADLRPTLKSAREKQILEPGDALQVIRLLRLCRALSRATDKMPGRPGLRAIGLRLDPLPELLKELTTCISDEGEIRGNATPQLRQALRETQAAKQALETQVARLMARPAVRDALQDNYFTEREERIVLPIRADHKSQIQGIVHDSSGSGQTLFMEPAEIIRHNNQLKISTLQVEREKARILQMLAGRILTSEQALLDNLDHLVTLDLIHARARLARAMQATQCRLAETGRMDLRQARNPELVLDGQPVVANSITWDEATRVIIISGPNTGGKTVTLKTIGLMSLMARAGLFLPVAEGSRLLFFPEVYADIGDEQNIQRKLSTFSGHLEKIICILADARPGALILLDELGIATDPIEGAALAEAILIELKRKNMMALVSTHYLSLKTLAQTQQGFANACTEFDPDTLTPTYRLIFGVPGQSAALETAQRLGLDPAVIHRAQAIYEEKDHRAETLLSELTVQRLRLEKQYDEAREKARDAARWEEEQRRLKDALEEEQRAFETGRARRLKTAVQEAKGEIQRRLRELSGQKEPRRLKKAAQAIATLAREPVSVKIPPGWDVPSGQVRKGDSVMVDEFGTIGRLLEDPGGKKKVRVEVGRFTLIVETSRLRGKKGAAGAGTPHPKPSKIEVHTDIEGQARQTVDLRGMTSDEAMIALEDFISQAIAHRLARGRIIHGHGMGTIKKLARDYLESTGVCQSFTPGGRQEGGDGITVVDFYPWDV
jgi:DNA mismatch repair protein MutS2